MINVEPFTAFSLAGRITLPFKLKDLFLHLFTNLTSTAVDGTRYLTNEGSDGTDAVMYTGQGAYFNGVDQNTLLQSPNQTDITVGTILIDVTCQGNLGDSHNILGNGWNERVLYTPSTGGLSLRLGYFTSAIIFTLPQVNERRIQASISLTEDGYVTVCTPNHTETKLFDPACRFIHSFYLSSREVLSSFSSITSRGVYLIPAVQFALAQFETHRSNPEKTLYWDAGVLKSDILDQATIDSMQAGNGFWYPMTENVSAGGYYRNHALTIPSNLVVNGGFDADTNWVKPVEWTIASGVASCNYLGGSGNKDFYQSSVIVDLGTTHIVEFEVKAYTSGTLSLYTGSSTSTGVNGIGAYRAIVTPSSSTLVIFAPNSGGFVGSIDNVKTYPLAGSGLTTLTNWTSTTTTNAEQLTTGYQCALQELDSFGLPIGKLDGLLHGDGRGYIDLLDQRLDGDWELDIYAVSSAPATLNEKLFKWHLQAISDDSIVQQLQIYRNTGDSAIQVQGAGGYTSLTAEAVITFSKSASSMVIYFNGVSAQSGTLSTPDCYILLEEILRDTSNLTISSLSTANLQVTSGTRTDAKRTADVNALMTKYGVV